MATLKNKNFFLALPIILGGAFLFFNYVYSASQGNVIIEYNVAIRCGNGVKEVGEQCDGNDLGGASCANQGFSRGNIACKVNCTFDTSDCTRIIGNIDNPPLIINVQATSLTPQSEKVSWVATDDNGVQNTKLEYGLSDHYGNEAVAQNVNGTYEVTLQGLQPNTDYYYRISASDAVGQMVVSTGTFKTAPELPQQLSIDNVNVVPAQTTARVTWHTNILADSTVLWGETNEYQGGVLNDPNLVQDHGVNIVGLLPNRLYHYKVRSQGKGQVVESEDKNFTTAKDNVPPTDVLNFDLKEEEGTFVLSWTNPNLSDFVGVKVLRKVGAKSANVADGDLVYQGSGESFTEDKNNILKNIEYFYTIFSYDTSENYSGGVFKSGKMIPPPDQEICGNGLDDDNNGAIDCQDNVCKDLPACQPPRQEICGNGLDDDNNGVIDCQDNTCKNLPICRPQIAEICNNGIDDDEDGTKDCADADCKNFPACQGNPGNPGGPIAELCDNGLDDDNDGKIDCADADCAGFVQCVAGPQNESQNPEIKPACSDGLDNDSDGKIDFPNDPGCESIDDIDEYENVEPNVPMFAHLNAADLQFLAANRRLNISLTNNTITGLSGVSLSIGISRDKLSGPPKSLTVKMEGGDMHQFAYNAVANTYFADLNFPSGGPFKTYLDIDYDNDQHDSLILNITGLSFGQVTGKDGLRLNGVEINLLDSNKKTASLGEYGESNPVVTNLNGMYGWMVPNGQYFIQAKTDKYYSRVIPVEVKNNIVNLSFSLIPQPSKIQIDSTKSVSENIVNVAKNVVEQTTAISQMVAEKTSDIVKDPQVKETTGKVVVPTTVGVATVGTVALVSWSNLLSFLQFIFLQPVLLLGRKKRTKWGQVYNALSKMPVDLAIVRLLDVKTGKVVQSRVTDKKGRYVFNPKPGLYQLLVQKQDLAFPSVLLAGFKDDGRRTDIYHGEVIKVDEKNVLIAVNIPLDPMGAQERPRRLLWQRFLRRLQLLVSWTGLFVTAFSLYITQVWYVAALLVVHLLVFLLFRRLSIPPKPKGWGIVYDRQSKKPIGKTVARLFDSQFNKLVATQITDNKGRYYFLAADNSYYVTYDHATYTPYRTEIIDLSNKDDDFIAINVGLQKTKK